MGLPENQTDNAAFATVAELNELKAKLATLEAFMQRMQNTPPYKKLGTLSVAMYFTKSG